MNADAYAILLLVIGAIVGIIIGGIPGAFKMRHYTHSLRLAAEKRTRLEIGKEVFYVVHGARYERLARLEGLHTGSVRPAPFGGVPPL